MAWFPVCVFLLKINLNEENCPFTYLLCSCHLLS
jgi:hypothetical protein